MSDLMYNLGHQQTINPALRYERSRGSSHRSDVPMSTSDHTPDFSLKRCSRGANCLHPSGPLLPCIEFNKDKNRKSGLHHRCRLCAADAQRRTIEKDPERYRQLQREAERRWHDKNIEKAREKSRRWRKENPEKKRASQKANRLAYPEKERARTRRYQKLHRAKMNELHHRRRTRMLSLENSFTLSDWQRCLEYWGNRCAYCGRPQGLWHILIREHYIPVTRGGGYIPTNIVPACQGIGGCNNSKRDHEPREWLEMHFGKRKALHIEREVQKYFDLLKEKKECQQA